MPDRIELLPGKWYGWQMMPGYGDAPYFSPIRVDRVTPLKTGAGRLQLQIWNVFYAEGVQGFDLTMRVLKRERDYLMAELEYPQTPGLGRACVINEMTLGWLETCTPQVIAYANEHDMNTRKDVQALLARVFLGVRAGSGPTSHVDTDLMDSELVDWAHRYNGYERLASSMNALGELLQPVRKEYQRSGRVPEWCGVDLLRGWAFGLVRAERIWGMDPDEFHAVLNALRRHPAATPADVPPLDTMGGVD